MIVGNMTVFFLFLLIPLVILLHIIMRRMESHSVSSTYIWERVKIKRKYTLPPVLLLLLQIMVIVLIILSLADLKVPFTIPLRRENSVLIIDNSASMNVVEKGKSRLDDAKEKAINVIRGSSGETMIITCASPPEIIISYTDKSDDLIKAVKSIENTELSNGIEEVMKIASASVTPEGSIIMVSDGAFNYRPSETDNFKFIRAGNEEKKNIGITDFYLREITGSDSFELYMTVSSFASEKTEFTFQLSAGDEIIKEGDYVIEALETMPFIFPIESQADKEIHGRLITDDLLQTDNSASAYISSHRNKRILLVTPGNFFLEKALESLDGVLLETYTGMVENEPSIQSGREHNIFSSSGIPIQKIPDNYDVVIFDRIPPPQKDDTGRFIYIDVIPSGVRTSGEKVEPRTVSVSRKHPVLESVDFSRITILKAWPSLSGSQIQEIVTGGNTGLLYVFQSRFLKFLYLPFDLTDSDLPLRASFPILMKNSIDWLTEGYSREEIIQLRSGDSIRIGRAVPEYSKTLITYPSGKKKTIEGNLFSRTFETGLYGFQYAEQMYYGSVNLNNRDESDISSRFPDVTEEDREEKTGEYKFSLMTVFLILGLLVLVAEWFVQESKW